MAYEYRMLDSAKEDYKGIVYVAHIFHQMQDYGRLFHGHDSTDH